MKYINEDKTIITLPVPLGTTLYQVTTGCGDFCMWQEDRFNKVFPPIKEGRCGHDKPCHTVEWHIYKITLAFHNMEYMLNNFGTWVFASRKEAEKRSTEIVENNRNLMRQYGFEMRKDGYGLTKEATNETLD